MATVLDGIVVLDLTQLFPGPYCTMLLGDFGADIIKIEPPGVGDFGRMFPYLFQQINRNKRSLTLNLKEKRAQDIFHRLAEKADVVVEGFRPGTTARLGVDYQTLKKINPRIIYCSISGFGQDGPYRDRPGHDINYMSLGGALSILTDGEGRPITPGLEIADVVSGKDAAISILAAIIARERTGEGQFLDNSMLDSVISLMYMQASAYFATGSVPERPMLDLCPQYRNFLTADGLYLTIGIVHEDWFWKNLCEVMGMEDLAGYSHVQRIEHRDEILPRMEKIIKEKTLSEWLELLEGRDICYSTVNNIAQVFEDPHVLHRQMKVTIPAPGGHIDAIGTSHKMSATPVIYRKPAPDLGESNQQILEELGFSLEEIENYKKEGII